MLLIGTLCLFVVLIMSLAGAGFFTKINVFLFVIQFGSILIAIIAMFFGGFRVKAMELCLTLPVMLRQEEALGARW